MFQNESCIVLQPSHENLCEVSEFRISPKRTARLIPKRDLRSSGVIVLPTQITHDSGEIIQNYGSFVLFDPPKKDYKMIPAPPKLKPLS